MKLLRLLLVPFAFLAVGIIRLLARFGILIRFGVLWSDRIGHLAGNTECYLCEREAGLQPKSFDIWMHKGRPANKQYAKMLSRSLFIDPTGFTKLVMLVNQMFQGWKKHFVQSEQLDRDIKNLWEKQQPHVKLTAEEERRGEAQLMAWGLPEGAKFVCLIVRDSAYIPQLGYHSFRDSDIQDYGLAVKALVDRGYYVFRMGAKVNKCLADCKWPEYSERVVDYANYGMRSDFMDVYLGAKCEFCISTGCGFDVISCVFRRPVVYVNYVPVEYFFTFGQGSLAIWKHHYKAGKKMSFKEIVESGAGQFMRSDEYEEAGITLKDNSPEEIRDVVIEHVDRSTHARTMANYWREMYSNQEEDQQAEFWKSFPRSISPYNNKPLHGEIRMRIGREFLKCEMS